MTQTEALRLAFEAMKIKQEVTMWANDGDRAKFNKAIAACEAALLSRSDGEAKDEPVAWKWHQAPVKTSWGDGMVVADLAIDKDHTASIYCERDQTAKFEAMSTPPQRKPLTDEEVLRLLSKIDECAVRLPRGLREFARAIEAAHGIKGEA